MIKNIAFLSKARTVVATALLVALLVSAAPRVTFAAAPTGASAVVTNSTATTVDVVITGTSFDQFISAQSTTANGTDLAKITYRGTSPTSAVINNSTTITATFPISIGTDKSGSLVVAANAVEDAGNTPNLTITIVNGSITDTAQPQYSASATLDNNNDGTVDFVRVTYTEAVTDSTVAAADFAVGIADTTAGNLTESFASLTPSTGNVTDTANDAVIYVGVAAGTETITAKKTDYTLKVQQVGAVSDAAAVPNALATFTSKTSTDAAKPIIKTVTTDDTDSDGLIDKLTYTWSENVDTDNSAAPVSADLPTTLLPDGQSATFGSATISDPAGASAAVVVTGVTGQVTENTAAGSTAISGDLSAKWVDGAANAPHATGGTGNETVVDNAAPVVVSVTPTDGAVDQTVSVEPVVVFSEAMDTTSLTFTTDQPAPTTFTQTWSVGDTTVTLGHDANFDKNATYTATVSEADAAAGATVALAEAFDWSFTIVAPTSGGGGGGGGGSTKPKPTTTNPGKTLPELQAMLKDLMAKLAELKGTPVAIAGGVFSMDLDLGASGADVSKLQAWLIAKGYKIEAGATGYFGAQTQAALAAYQKAMNITPALGFFGPKTRASVNGS